MDDAVLADLAQVEQLGYTRNEALDLVIRRALSQERDASDDATGRAAADRYAYLDRLRGICIADVA